MGRPEVQERAGALRRDRVPFVHARVVRAERPTSAKPGDEALVLADGTVEGFIGGVCAASTVRAQALALLDSGDTLLVRITPVEDDGAPVVPGTVVAFNPCLSGGALEIFLEPVVPAPLVAVHGDTPIAAALLALGAPLGYHMVTWQPGVAAEAAGVVVASHGRDEENVLTAAVKAGVPYVGLVASRKRGEAVMGSLPVDAAARARIRTPAGLDIGARSPEEVALSILAEIVALRPRPSATTLPEEETHASGTTTAHDPVCGMAVAVSQASLHLDHEENRYWFCGSGCLRAFAADPAAYASGTPHTPGASGTPRSPGASEQSHE
ncbi:MAG: XdhC family protein [Actinomycetota bacterium]|nr:XdhC family protein [Actinomycetota bacterium]